ncbi:hypothetical protein HELRODRAFT_175723 [Helobdella robusta]|uniref:G-protein coupled receptors family 1 profile domain-containing protein n=1 Tax=Helobdella robusta TaxID=6412 RepID=T1F9K6_HELRO|nr:hypothetical protein HELRODRAFT_175723 [Helobdella robusta]ESO00732.1 hypothetical protein HELRODRAFT_175723 [Helobdella robusta]
MRLQCQHDSRIKHAEGLAFTIIVPTICCIGMLLNFTILLILKSKRNFPESTYFYLFHLALADFLTLGFFCLNSVGKGFYPKSFHWRMYEIYVYFYFGSICSNASIFITVTVTVESHTTIVFIYNYTINVFIVSLRFIFIIFIHPILIIFIISDSSSSTNL